MQCQLIPATAVQPSHLERWRDLVRRAAEPNPWFEPSVLVPLSKIQNDIGLLVASRGPTWHLCLPLMRMRRKWAGIEIDGWTTPHPVGTPLADAVEAEEALRCALRWLARAEGPRVLSIRALDTEAPLTAIVARALGEDWRCKPLVEGAAWPAMRRRKAPTYLDERVSPKQRHNIQRLRRRLEERLGSALRLVDRGGDVAAMDRFIALEAAGWKGRKGTALACDTARAGYFRAVCSGFAADRRFRLYCLEAGGRAVAMKAMTRAGNALVELRVAYDEGLARFSPGVQLEVDAIEAFHGDDSLAVALSHTNYAESPLFRIWPDRIETSGITAGCAGAGRQALASLLGIGSARKDGTWPA